MKLVDAVFGNANISSELSQDILDVLLDGEKILFSFKLVRDEIAFTSWRVIYMNKKGVSGKQTEITTYPLNNITSVSKQSAGSLDSNVEIFIYIKGLEYPVTLKFNKEVNITPIYKQITTILYQHHQHTTS